MSDRHDVIIYMRSIRLEVVIPERYVWEFMAEFGKTFAIEDLIEGITSIRSVDGYYDHPNGWHIKVSVGENKENKFYEFLHNFCLARSLSFREPQHNA